MDVKAKIVGSVFSLRKLNINGRYRLDQFNILQMISHMWGASCPANILHCNDHVRLYGIVMSIPHNHTYYQLFAERYAQRPHIVDPAFSFEIFQNMTLLFNYERIIVTALRFV